MGEMRTASYWEPSGWTEEREVPLPYQMWWDAHDDRPDSSRRIKLEDYGYGLSSGLTGSVFRSGDRWEIQLHQHEDGHLLVDVMTNSWPVAFVAKEWAGAFYMQGFQQTFMPFAIMAMNENLERLDKTLRAFVRYGISEDTIEADGLSDRDDRRESARRYRERREREAKAQPAT